MIRVPLLFCLGLLPITAPARAADTPIELSVDATEAPRKLLHAKMVIPAKPGPLTLLYPMWIQGEHGPNGPINDLSGLTISAAGKPLVWTRDDLDLYAFHCTVPEGATAVDVSLDYLGATSMDGYSTGVSSTDKMAIFNWHLALVYPKGKPVREIPIRANITLPKGWKVGTAVPVESEKPEFVQFKTVSLEKLADSPAICGLHFKEFPLGTGDGPKHFMVVAADSEAALAMPPELKAKYDKLVAEAGALFGSRHYESYRFLVTLSDAIRSSGIEHHECSDNRAPEKMFVDGGNRKNGRDGLFSHEFTHSWNGKFRRPEGIATSDFQKPMITKHLWIYEGLTEYYGYVLECRSGLTTPEMMRDKFAALADWSTHQGGRQWRSLEDTARTAPFLYNAGGTWANRRRGVDFYNEGALIWLDADTLIREKTGGKKSLDDFSKSFFGGPGGKPEVKPYALDEVLAELNKVLPYDWKAFFETRVNAVRPEAPLEGLTRSGWKLVYKSEPSERTKADEAGSSGANLNASIGLSLGGDGTVSDVVQGKAADKAGVGPGMKLLAVNGRKWNAERLKEAVAETKAGGPLHLLFENQDYFKTLVVDYKEGAKYPHLERGGKGEDYFGDILKGTSK